MSVQTEKVYVVVIRHDVNPTEYLACEADHPAVFQLQPASGVATLVAETWAITAAHCLYLLIKDNYEEVPFKVQIADREHTIVDAVYPPECGAIDEVKMLFREARDHREDTNSDVFVESVFTALEKGAGPHDIALLRLERPATHVKPIALYQNNDEVGQEVLMLGWGAFSTGEVGITQGYELDDGKFRQTRNVISRITNGMLAFDFDAPSTVGALPLEGVNGPGDSGGPALISTEEGDKIAGISSYSSYPTEELDERARKGGIPIQMYGTVEHYTRVSSHLSWIQDVVRSRH